MMKNEILFKNGELEVRKTLQEMLKEQTGKTAVLPVPNYDKGTFALKTIDCNFHFLKDINAYARLLECAHLVSSVRVMESDLSKLKETDREEGLTEEQADKKRALEETIVIFNKVISEAFNKEQIAFADADKLIKFMAVYYSKDTSAFANFNGFQTFLNNIEADKPTQTLKPLLETVMDNFTIAQEDDIYKSYRFHGNTGLIEDIKKVYYKGRKIKKGKVVQSYDKQGKAVKLEIVLAVIEDLQTKSRKKYEEEQAKAQAEAEVEAKKQEEMKKKAEEEAIAKAKAKEAEAKAKAEAEKKEQAKK
jgi:hypothetical protein